MVPEGLGPGLLGTMYWPEVSHEVQPDSSSAWVYTGFKMGRAVSPKSHVCPEPQNVTLCGNGAFADVIKVRMEMR